MNRASLLFCVFAKKWLTGNRPLESRGKHANIQSEPVETIP